MAADAAALAGVPLSELGPATVAALDAKLPPTWSHANPVDIIGDAPVRRYTESLQTLLDDRNSGAVLFLHAPTAIVRSDEIARACAPLVRQAAGRVMACWLGDRAVAEARDVFVEAAAADYPTPEEAVRAFAMLATYRRNQALLLEAPTASENGPPQLAIARAVVDRVLADGRHMLDELEAKTVLRAYGIPVVETVAVAASPAEAACAAAKLGYPVAIKILSPDISHKSDVGGVVLDLTDERSVRSAAQQMLERVGAARPAARLTGFTVQRMVRRPLAQELIVGASVDPLFGPVVLFGQGGTAVEVIADRAIALPPLNRVLARELVSRTRVSRLLAGFRDHPPARIEAVCDVLIALSQMLADLPELAELDINPLCADHEGVIALDARLRLDARQPAGAERFAITPYPAELVETIDWHGESIVVRPIRPEDEAQHREFVEQLSSADLRLRFFYARRELPRSELARLTQIDYAREMAFVAVRRSAAGREETLGVVRAVSDPDNVEAELAIVVRSDLKGRGLGQRLLASMTAYLAGRGTRRVVCHVLPENSAMRGLAASAGFVIDRDRSDPDAVRLVLPLNESAPVA
jgi:acetyltransferase